MRHARRRRDPVLPAVRRHDPTRRPRLGRVGLLRVGRHVPSSSSLLASSRVVATSDSAPPGPPGRPHVRELQQRDIGHLRRLPGMRGPGSSRRRGRRGRRTAAMIRAAQERIQDLFSLAEVEVHRAPSNLSQRYVFLARRIGMRYNVRLLREYRDVYCRGCSTFWVEGLSVRTRLRGGRRAQTCLQCGRVRRTLFKFRRPRPSAPEGGPDRSVGQQQAVLIDEGLGTGSEPDLDEAEDQ